MKKTIVTLILISGFFIHSYSQIVLKTPHSSRQTGYKINATLKPEDNIVDGEMVATWVNLSMVAVNDAQMHLYLNAFRNRNSTFYRESGGDMIYTTEGAGWIDINSISDKKGTNLINRMKFISPDDGNPDDMTVLKVNLPEPCFPGDTLTLKIKFRSKLPSTIIRTGSSGDFFFVAQWFPKFGVYEPAGFRYAMSGGWNCHQFHRNSEFYANHSIYEVTINLPEKYVVGSCGMLLNESVNDDGIKTISYRAEDIVDFAWTAWPDYAVYMDKWRDVDITLLIPPERKIQVSRQLAAVKDALEYLDENVGPYPWPYLTIVDPPSRGGGAGGMEYTTLFTSTSFYGVPGFLRLPELVTIHEFGHSYFMGIFASNEFEEPWLDEGITTFWEGRIVDHFYGTNSGLLNHRILKIPDRYAARASYINSGSRQAISNAAFAWNFPHETYSMMSYHKTAVIMETLMGMVGEETMNEIFREYYKRWAFKYPSGRNFIDVVSDVVVKIHGTKFGPDMNWFFDQTIYGTDICDYKVTGFSNRKEYNITGSDSTKNEFQATDSTYKSVVELERAGGVTLPVEVLIHFDNGKEVTEYWDGKSRIKDYSYSGKGKINWVKIDPDFKIKMDVNYANNSRTDEPDQIPVRRLTDKLISFLQFFISFISL